MRYLPRALTATVRRALKTFPAVLVTGARQTGKTTLLRKEFGQSHRYLSLERPEVRERALADPVGFLDAHPDPVILDEIQRAPELLHPVKDRIDERRAPGRWLLGGSQSFALMQGVGQTLAGRVAVLSLDAFSVAEATGGRLGKDPIKRVFDTGKGRARSGSAVHVSLEDWLLRGSFPEPRANPSVDRKLWYSSYIQTYLERDVRDLVQVGDLGSFHRFLRLVAAHTGQLLNLAELGRDAGVTGPTARCWLSVLETSQVVHLVPPFYRNLGKRIRKSPKVYWLDTGLPTFLQGLHDPEAVRNGPSIGALAETAVVSEWVKALRQRGEPADLFYWRSARGMEVDLVLERNGRLHGLEIKATRTPTPHHADSIAAWLELAGPSALGALACDVAEPTPLRAGIRAVPWHLAW